MGVATQVTTLSDMVTDLQTRVRTATGVTSTDNVAKRYLNQALQDMHIGFNENFPWAERRAFLLTQPQYTTGTVSINKGSTTLTGSGTAWNTANDFGVNNARAGGKIVVAGTQTVYEVASVGGDTSITLTAKFIDDDVSGETYRYFEDEYDLDDDFLRPVDARNFDDNREIELLDRQQFRRLFVRNSLCGRPDYGCIVSAPTSTTEIARRIRLHRPPDQAYQLPYSFITNKLAVGDDGTAKLSLVEDDDEPIVPLPYRHAIVLYALADWYRDAKDDDRENSARANYTDLVARIVGDQEIGAVRAHIKPRLGPYASSARRPYSHGRGRRYTAGTAFDQLRDR